MSNVVATRQPFSPWKHGSGQVKMSNTAPDAQRPRRFRGTFSLWTSFWWRERPGRECYGCTRQATASSPREKWQRHAVERLEPGRLVQLGRIVGFESLLTLFENKILSSITKKEAWFLFQFQKPLGRLHLVEIRYDQALKYITGRSCETWIKHLTWVYDEEFRV